MFENRFKNYQLDKPQPIFKLKDIINMVKGEIAWVKESGYWGDFNELNNNKNKENE